MIVMNDLRKVAEELNIKLDLTPKIRKIGISREGIIEQILDAAELILPHDDITKFSNKIIEDIKIPKGEEKEKTEKKQSKSKDIKVKVKVEKKKVNKTNKYDLMFKKVKVNKRIVKTKLEAPDNDNDYWDITWNEEIESNPWEGRVIGYRKKFEGFVESNSFCHKNTVNCVLVIKNPISNPIPVPMDGFDIVE